VPRITGKVVQINMDSRCSVRNLVKGGGPVESLCGLVKDVWVVCRELGMKVSMNWLRRNEAEMVVVDALSKEGTMWALRPDFQTYVQTLWGLDVFCPDFARIGPEVKRVLAEERRVALVLPKWEGMSWWVVVEGNARWIQDLPDWRLVFATAEHHRGNSAGWTFVLCNFNY